ncbi:His-Xaa-Ser system protein HxsD [Sorangium sp. So ce1078]|uniref:His-Xaa-Ser system protein HxsD n=1 Tax=Sorangium sp. So ce1078 TaxID=3133329 RepID=UPI003F631499
MGADAGAPFAFRDGHIVVTVDLRIYRLAAVQKAAYRMAAKCTVVIGEIHDHSLDVALAFPPTTGEQAAREAARLFFQELLDQELREKLGEETASLRTLILAHAFSRARVPRRG